MKKLLLFTFIITALLLISYFTTTHYSSAIRLPTPDFTDWSKAKTVADSTNDVSGNCGQDHKTHVDLIEAKVADSSDYLYLYWKIKGGGSWFPNCSNSDFWTEFDSDNDGKWEYRVDYVDKECLMDGAYSMISDAEDTKWPPTPIYNLSYNDVNGQQGTYMQVRVQKGFLKLGGQGQITVRMGIDQDFPTSDCSDSTQTFIYTLSSVPPPAEDCEDRADNDGDGYVDCGDSDCADHEDCVSRQKICDDDFDNDGDDKIDCQDSDCYDQEYCDSGIYVVKFKGRLIDAPTIGDNNYWHATVKLISTVLDPKNEIQNSISEIGKSKFYLQGPSDRVEKLETPAYPNDEIEVVASFSYDGKDMLFIHDVKFLPQTKIDITGRLLSVEQEHSDSWPWIYPWAKLKVCDSDYQNIKTGDEVEIGFEAETTGGDYESELQWPQEIKDTIDQQLAEEKLGDCKVVNMAELKGKGFGLSTSDASPYLEVSPYRYNPAPEEWCEKCGHACARLGASIETSSEIIPGTKISPSVTIKNNDEKEITIESAELDFLDQKHALENIKLSGNESYNFTSKDLIGKPYEIPASITGRFTPMELSVQYRDSYDNLCEIKVSERLTVKPVEDIKLNLKIELSDSVYDLKDLRNLNDVFFPLKVRASIPPEQIVLLPENHAISFSLPCEIITRDCLGYYELPLKGEIQEDGTTAWFDAEVVLSADNIGDHFFKAEVVEAVLSEEELRLKELTAKRIRAQHEVFEKWEEYHPTDPSIKIYNKPPEYKSTFKDILGKFEIKGKKTEHSPPECKDEVCKEALSCLTNFEQCKYELIDIIPYTQLNPDPTSNAALRLLTNDICEMSDRIKRKDRIGIMISSMLLSIDFADNIADAAPGAGNLAGIIEDTIEGTLDCLEGYVYEAAKQCGGYEGCLLNPDINLIFGIENARKASSEMIDIRETETEDEIKIQLLEINDTLEYESLTELINKRSFTLEAFNRSVEEVLAEKSAEKLKEIEDIKTQIKQVEKDIKRLEQLKQDEEKLKELDLWNPEMLIVFKIGSPVELAVHDNKGKLLSKRDGVFVMDKEDMKFAVIFNPQNLENGYNIHVRGTDAGTYSYTMTGIKDKQIVFQDEVKDVPIKEGEAVTFRAKLGQAEVELKDSSSDQEEQEKKAGSFWNLKNIVFVVGVIVVVLIILVIIWFKKRKGKAYL